jgi:hypothetical protein
MAKYIKLLAVARLALAGKHLSAQASDTLHSMERFYTGRLESPLAYYCIRTPHNVPVYLEFGLSARLPCRPSLCFELFPTGASPSSFALTSSKQFVFHPPTYLSILLRLQARHHMVAKAASRREKCCYNRYFVIQPQPGLGVCTCPSTSREGTTSITKISPLSSQQRWRANKPQFSNPIHFEQISPVDILSHQRVSLFLRRIYISSATASVRTKEGAYIITQDHRTHDSTTSSLERTNSNSATILSFHSWKQSNISGSIYTRL